MANTYQSDVQTVKAVSTPYQREIQHKAIERKLAEARTAGSSSYQTTFATIRGESATQREVDYKTNERQIAEAEN